MKNSNSEETNTTPEIDPNTGLPRVPELSDEEDNNIPPDIYNLCERRAREVIM